MLLSLVVWVGGIIFFSFVVAPTVFTVLPTRQLAGAVVTRSLASLHWIAIISAVVFLASSFIVAGRAAIFRQKFFVLMPAPPFASQFCVSPRCTAPGAAIGGIDLVWR